ncbi:MAG: sensor histidine kinase [Lachnospiraceae bacterium]|nr:sensor histidine kinase [Lachnospiraceae bacterium]
MKISEYLKSKSLIFMIHFICMLLLSFFLLAVGNTLETAGIILSAWFLIAGLFFVVDYRQRDHYFRSLFSLLNHLDKRYLIGEMMPDSFRIDDKKYKQIIQKSNKSVMEAIHIIEDTGKDYQEYIESWVHEIKTPLTSIHLICANHKDENTRKILVELSKVDNYVETVLFYAKSNQVHNDYMIKEYSLKEMILETIAKHQQYLIQNQMNIKIDCEAATVPCDKKWMEFILTQLLLNAVKYKKGETGTIVFSNQKGSDHTTLIVQDFGIGIPESDLSRVFEKGFTGQNGRTGAGLTKATGMGLYLCKKLCVNLGLDIKIDSVFGEYTNVLITFPKSSHITKV